MATQLHKPADAAKWNSEADARRAAIDKYLWNPAKGMYFDYDFEKGEQATYDYITTFYPLWAGAANEEQIAGVEKNLKLIEQPGGIAMSDYDSGVQWDLPFGWAPGLLDSHRRHGAGGRLGRRRPHLRGVQQDHPGRLRP